MKTIGCVVLAALSFAPVACKAPPEDVCGGSDARYYDEGLVFYLEKAHVPFRKTPGGGLCVAAKYGPQLKAAERELDRYFPRIAHNPRDACEERALVEWARRENLRYDVRAAYDAAKRPSGNLFLLRAYTHEEMVAYREKLDRSAPIGAGCTTGG